MAKKLLRFSLWLTGSTSVVITGVILLGASFSASTVRVVSASEEISQPKFPYEVAHQYESNTSKLKVMYVVTPKEYCSEENVRSLFQWHSKESPYLDYIFIDIFTSRENADWAYAHRPEIETCTPRIPSLWERISPKWNASYWRITQEWAKETNRAEERYEYKPFAILPFWKKEVILKPSPQ